jgi:hypothetical protein
MSRAMCRGTQTRGGDEVVDDEPARGRVVNYERRDEPRTSRATCRGTGTRGVVDVEPLQPGTSTAAHGKVDVEPLQPGDEYSQCTARLR